MSMSRAEIIANLETRYFSDEMDEAAELAAFPRQLTSVRAFFDIGAAIGQYTKVANEHLRNATMWPLRRILFGSSIWRKTAVVGNDCLQIPFKQSMPPYAIRTAQLPFRLMTIRYVAADYSYRACPALKRIRQGTAG